MPTPPDPENTRKVERVRALLASDPKRSARSACQEVGLAESTFRSRIDSEGSPRPRGVAGGQLAQAQQPSGLAGGDIEIPVIHRDYSDEATHHFYPLGDLHKGSPAHDVAKWREWLGYFEATPEASLVFTGDGFNAALTTSVSDTYSETMTVRGARKALQEELRPLADRNQLDVVIPGNHEWRIERATGDCPLDQVCDVLDVADRYAPDCALVVYHVGDIEYELYVIHGTRGGRRAGGRANALEDMQDVIDADIYVQAHAHTKMSFPQQRFRRAGDKLERRTRSFVGSGSFLGYESYAARAGYRPTMMGAPRVRLDGRRYDVHVST